MKTIIWMLTSMRPLKISLFLTIKSTLLRMMSHLYKMILPQSMPFLKNTKVKLYIIKEQLRIKSWKIMISTRISHKLKTYWESESIKLMKEEDKLLLSMAKIKVLMVLIINFKMIFNYVENTWKLWLYSTMTLSSIWKDTHKKTRLLEILSIAETE